jgi:predicted nucleic acid-binding protein
MELNDVPDGALVFIDANILVYHFLKTSPQCSHLVARIGTGDVLAVCGAHIVAEMAHRLMIREAQATGSIVGSNPAAKLKKQPQTVCSLTQYQASIDLVLQWVPTVAPVTTETLQRSAEVRARYGLLVNDSLTVAMLQLSSTNVIASADRDFARVPGLAVYTPSDI